MATRTFKTSPTNGNWATAANWAEGAIPTSSDDVFIPWANGTIYTTANMVCKSLTIQTTVTITQCSAAGTTAYSFTIGTSGTAGTGDVTINNGATLNHYPGVAATMTINGSLTNNGTFNGNANSTVAMSGANTPVTIYSASGNVTGGAASGAFNNFTITKNLSTRIVTLTSNLYCNAYKSSVTGMFTHATGTLVHNGFSVYCSRYQGTTSNRILDMSVSGSSIVMQCTSAGATMLTLSVSPNSASVFGAGSFFKFTGGVDATFNIPTTAALAFYLSLESSNTFTISNAGYLLGLQCVGTISGSLFIINGGTLFNNINSNRNSMSAASFNIAAYGSTVTYDWAGTINSLTFSSTSAATFDIQKASATTLTLSSANCTYTLSDVTGSVCNAQGAGSTYTFNLKNTTTGVANSGFSTSLTLGATSTTKSDYTLSCVHQSGSLILGAAVGASDTTVNYYRIEDIQITNTGTGVTFLNRGYIDLYGNNYVAKFNMNAVASYRYFSFGGSINNGVLSGPALWISGPSGITQFDATTITGLTMINSNPALFIICDSFNDGNGTINLPTTGILTDQSNLFQMCILTNPSLNSGGNVGAVAAYGYTVLSNTYIGSYLNRPDGFYVGGVGNTVTINCYGPVQLSNKVGSGVSWSNASIVMLSQGGATDSQIQCKIPGNATSTLMMIATLTINLATTYYLILTGDIYVTYLVLTRGNIYQDYGQTYSYVINIELSVTITNNSNSKEWYAGTALDGNVVVYRNYATGSTPTWTCARTDNFTWYGDGYILMYGGTIDQGSSASRKYDGQPNFYIASTYVNPVSLSNPFIATKFVARYYTPVATWVLSVLNLTWYWTAGSWGSGSSINFNQTGDASIVSFNQTAGQYFPVIQVNGPTLYAFGNIDVGTLQVVTGSLLAGKQLYGYPDYGRTNLYVYTLLSCSDNGAVVLDLCTITAAGTGGQTTSGIYCSPNGLLDGTYNTEIIMSGSTINKYLTFSTNYTTTIGRLTNSTTYDQSANGILFIYTAATVTINTITNTVNPSAFRQMDVGTIQVENFAVRGTAGGLAYWQNSVARPLKKISSGNINTNYLNLQNSNITTSSVGQLFYAGSGSVDSGGNTGWIFGDEPSYILTISGSTIPNPVNEGTTITVTLTTTGVTNGTLVPYTITTGAGYISPTATNPSDIDGSPGTTGNFTINSNVGTRSFTFTADRVTEGSEMFTLNLDNGKASISINVLDTYKTPTYSLAISPGSINEGSTATVTLTTANLEDGYIVPFTISGTNIDTSDYSTSTSVFASTSSFTIASNSASVNITAKKDFKTEGTEILTLTLTGIGTSVNLTILDTSKSGAYNFFTFFPI